MSTFVKILIFLIINATTVKNQDVNTYNITVKISGLKNSNGQLLVGLYNSEVDFLEKGFKSLIQEISNKTGTVIFYNIPEGTYAVSFVHDENNNGEIDTNFIGIPKEDYGCSNNAKGTMGPPKWEDAKFELKGENKTIKISL